MFGHCMSLYVIVHLLCSCFPTQLPQLPGALAQPLADLSSTPFSKGLPNHRRLKALKMVQLLKGRKNNVKRYCWSRDDLKSVPKQLSLPPSVPAPFLALDFGCSRHTCASFHMRLAFVRHFSPV